MELSAAVRVLFARRWLVGVGFLLAVAVGVLLAFKVSFGFPPTFHSRQHYDGEAGAQVLIDTPNSQIADLTPRGGDALYPRATLLADIMATAPVQQAIAGQLGISPYALTVTPPPLSIVVPIKETPVAVAASGAAIATSRYKLAVGIDPNLPIIAFKATAPTPQAAGRLTAAAISILKTRMNAIASAQNIPVATRPVINPIGPPVVARVAIGPRKLYGLAAALVLFLMICFAIVMTAGRSRRRTMDRLRLAEWESYLPHGKVGAHAADPELLPDFEAEMAHVVAGTSTAGRQLGNRR